MSEINKDTNNGTSNNTYSDIGEEIKDQVNQAVASGDFSNLSSVISQTVAGRGRQWDLSGFKYNKDFCIDKYFRCYESGA